tara:strand:+ start:6232 stop:6900 length:669 start_codon:yes stop_codon:yes gene_type:complete
MSYLVNPYLYASSGEWYSYEDSSTYSIPVGPNLFSSPLPQYYDVGSGNEFYKFKYKASLSTSYAGGNYNGSISMWVGNLLKTSSQSGGYCPEGAFITTGRHRHNSGSTDQSYFAQNWNDSGGTCNVPTGTGCPQVSQINDYGCGDGLIVGSQNVELEYDGDDTGGTAYFRFYNSGFSSPPTSTNTWTINAMRELRYFLIGGRSDPSGNVSGSITYQKFEWFT